MEQDAKVKYRGIQVGEVKSIEYAGDQAKLTLSINSNVRCATYPSNAGVRIAGTTVFGAKSVEFLPPEQPSGQLRSPARNVQAEDGAARSQHAVPDPDRRAAQDRPGAI